MPIKEKYKDKIKTIIYDSIYGNTKLTTKIKSAISEAWLESDERKYIVKTIKDEYGENGKGDEDTRKKWLADMIKLPEWENETLRESGKVDEEQRLKTLDQEPSTRIPNPKMDNFIYIFKKKIMVPLLVNNVLKTFMKNIDENQILDVRFIAYHVYSAEKTNTLVKTIIDEIEKSVTINLKGKIDYSYQFEASSPQQSIREYAGKKRLHIKFNRKRDNTKFIKYNFWCNYDKRNGYKEKFECSGKPTIAKNITTEVMKEIVVFNEKQIESVIKSKAVKTVPVKIEKIVPVKKNKMFNSTLKF